jgi:hypothetical protein
VLSSGPEDMVITTRRRFIAHYQGAPLLHKPTPMGLNIVCPLEGIPRVASSGPGEDRDGGLRRHSGLDLVASEGEPVRALADGTGDLRRREHAQRPPQGAHPAQQDRPLQEPPQPGRRRHLPVHAPRLPEDAKATTW